MDNIKQLVIFKLEDCRYALPLFIIDKIIPAVEITNIPEAPDIVLGAINVRGQVIPVLNIRKRFGLPKKSMDLNDHIIIANTLKRVVALVVDSVQSVVAYPEDEIISSKKFDDNMNKINCAIKLDDEIVFVYDLNNFFYCEEEKVLVGIDEFEN